MPPNILSSSLQNASFNIIFQIGFRILTFLLNAFVLRHVSQAAVGVMNVRLLLLESTLLFLSREAFRRACLSKASEHYWPKVINLVWLTVPLCQILCLIFGYIWLNVLSTPSSSITEYYTVGVWSIAISCIIEMCCEPVYLMSEAFLFVRLKVVMQTMLVVVRTITFTSIVLYQPKAAVLAFSVAQILSITAYTVGYYIYFHFYMKKRLIERSQIINNVSKGRSFQRKDSIIGTAYDFPFNSISEFLPSKCDDGNFDYKLAKLTWSFFKQGILKQILTEGERYIMTLFSVLSFGEQGIYDVVNNLGSMAARFLFRPIEESAYFYFSQMIRRDVPIAKQDQKQVEECVLVLQRLLRCLFALGLVILVFGLAYSRLLLLLYGGSGLISGSGPLLLRTHCLSVLLLALNGITECYALASMDTKQLDRYNYVMVWLSIGFLCISWIFTRLLGGVGFILANCCNMAARITHSIHYIADQYQSTAFNPLKGVIPHRMYCITLFVSGLLTQLSEVLVSPYSLLGHFLIGAFCFLVTLVVWTIGERELVQLGIHKWNQRRAKSH
ncbi:protein RFT1 homolog [Frankliniella occidentalis]|uniref:Protein RFT1 homolog n=1 Tax=Frankliniella occidentalis TaxID=133901 RepID=A0A6J1T7A8_FRAOC|nr:protein RFT1 homolog [Frankliniella occidentalis]XP_026286537.1 protein RFT1 homolog [Frankliniella occidentalis]XP_052132064.1 protein RFT1 homolog [Frankliniella occidentalis]